MNLRRFGIWTNLAISAVLMLLVWVLVVWVASRPAFRVLIDMTPQKANTVSAATEDLLEDLRAEEAEVEFHLFSGELGAQAPDERSKQVVAIRSRLLQLTSLLLQRYAALGGEAVKVVEHNQYAQPALYRETAQAFGYTRADTEALIVAVRLKGKERRFRKLSLVSDLAVIDAGNSQQQAPGKANTLPVLKSYQGEKGISSALKTLLVQGTPVVYLIEGHSVMVDIRRRDHNYNLLIDAMAQAGLEVRPLNLRKAGGVPRDAAMVLCIEPDREFLPRDAEYLYAYLRRGGRLFINYVWSAIPDMNPTGGRLGELLGYELSRRPVFHRIPDTGRGGGSMDGTDGVRRLTLQKNPFHPTTRRLSESGRVIEAVRGREVRPRRDKPKNVRTEELLATGGEAWLAIMNGEQPDYRTPRGIKTGPLVVGLACELDPEPEKVDGAEPKEGGDAIKADPAKDKSSPKTGRVIVIAGQFCDDRLFPHFGDLALNICNWMTERKVLLDIETARYSMNSLEVKRPQYERIWWLQIIWVPGTFLVLGLLMWWRRRH
jgi:hypothetical protein